MPKTLPQPGHAYWFLYPRHNFHCVRSRLEPRRIVVTAIRDLIQDPLEPETVASQPLLRRSRYLIIGQDLDKHEERRFYHESIKRPKQIALMN